MKETKPSPFTKAAESIKGMVEAIGTAVTGLVEHRDELSFEDRTTLDEIRVTLADIGKRQAAEDIATGSIHGRAWDAMTELGRRTALLGKQIETLLDKLAKGPTP